jgi:hypothetical protein
MLDDGICLAKQRLDPGAVNHFAGQLLDGLGEATSSEFRFESAPPCQKAEPGIGSLWVSYTEKFGSALDGCSMQVYVNSDLLTWKPTVSFFQMSSNLGLEE